MGTRSSALLVTLVLLAASCSITADGLATTGVDDPAPPARAGMTPATADAGATSLTSSAEPVVVPADAAPAPVVAAADAGVAPPAGGPVTPPGMQPPATQPPVTQPPVQKELRAHDVKVKRLIAGTIYVHKLEANKGTAGKIVFLPAPLIDLSLATNIEVEELVVDTLYAHDVHADQVHITETHATEVRVGKKGGED